ncbi:MAG: hypothetical protein HOM21_11905, partial [Halobacteriovoraceae bacterium]|nr:hypothetical protein [Halobacteriovoraceae bacterium]
MKLDGDNKKHLPLIKFFSSKKSLVVATNEASRASIRGLFRDLQVPSQSIFVAESYKDAEKIIKENQPEIIISEYDIGDSDGLSLLDFHIQQFPNRIETVFCLISDIVNPAIYSEISSQAIDLHFSPPIIPAALGKNIVEISSKKMTGGEYLSDLEQGKALFRQGKDVDAIEVLQKAKEEGPSNTSMPSYFQGLIYHK